MNKIYGTIPVILLSLIGTVSAHAGDDYYSHHSMMGSWSYGIFGMGWYGWIIPLLVIAVLILLIILISKQIKESGKRKR